MNSRVLVWLCPSLLVSLLLSSNSKELGLMTSLWKLGLLCNPRPDKQLQMVHCYSPKPSLNLQVDNKRLRRTAAIVQRTIPFCIVLCSVDLFDSTPELGFSLALMSLMTTEIIENHCVREGRDCQTECIIYNHTPEAYKRIHKGHRLKSGGHKPGSNGHVGALQSYNVYVSQSQ